MYAVEQSLNNMKKTPILQQDDEDQYEGYVKLERPFTETDKYDYLDSFFMGLKLDEFFEFSDECLDAWVFMWDDFAYYKNNKTLVGLERDDPNEAKPEGWFHIFLNMTGIIGGDASAIVPECYQFGKSAGQREADRWERFGKSWGQFWLAFLFNQMGNALNFQNKVNNIRENTDA